jgi:Fe-S oxidoreductase
MKLQDPMKTVRSLVGDGAIKTDRCCGESGTLAVSRPDISTQVRYRKEEELGKNMDTLRKDGYTGPIKMLTSCPSCLQGLSRYEGDTGMEADYIVIEMARHILGEDWMQDYVRDANQGGIERVLV